MAKNPPDVGRSSRRAPNISKASEALASPKPKDVRLTVRLDPELKQQVHIHAITHGTTINGIISQCLKKFIEEVKD